jgi:phage host-nuclease inhibitor protein Gam
LAALPGSSSAVADVERYVLVDYWVDGYAEFETIAVPTQPGFGQRGGAGYTEEELQALTEASRRKRITKLIKELERQLAIEHAWTEAEYNGQRRPIVDEIHKLKQRKAAFAETQARDRRQAIIDEIADLERRKLELN